LDVGVAGEAGVSLLALRRLAIDAGAVAPRKVGLEIPHTPACARPYGDHRTWPVAGADDHVLGSRGAMKEVPGSERPLLAFDQQQRFPGEHEEAFLVLVLGVVEAGGLSGVEDPDVDSELRKPRVALTFETRVAAEGAFEPARLAGVQDEPALAFRREAFSYLLDRSFRDHPRILPLMEGLAELHTHLGGSVASDILWSLAHEQGIALPVKDFWEFDRLVTVSDPRGVANLDALDQIYHWTELIQSSPIAVERSVHAAIGGAYRSQGITTLELRFNPMKRNRGGERDLDHIILAAIRGLDRASLEYPQVRAGLILMMDRTFTAAQNSIIVEKAIVWAPRGVVGVDIAGPRPNGGRYDYRQVAPMVEEARSAGLGVTIHVGEEGGDMGRDEIGEVVTALRPDRIGHGILAAADPDLMGAIRDAQIVLEICPTSNLLTKALANEEAVRDTFRAFVDAGVPFTIATDGPEMMRTHLKDELELLRRIGALDEEELAKANRRGHEASFLSRDIALQAT
jgi:adenosine deaminase